MRKQMAFIAIIALLLLMIPLAAGAGNQDGSLPFLYTIENDEVYITGYTGEEIRLLIPDTIEGCPVVSVYLKGTKANIVELTLPSTIRELPEEALGEMTSLSRIHGIEYVQSIGQDAFAYTKMKELVFSENLKSIARNAFESSDVERLTIPNDIQIDLEYAGSYFYNYDLADIRTIPGSGTPTVDAVDGVLFTADHTALVLYPPQRVGFSYIIPSETTTLLFSSLRGLGYKLKELLIPATVTVFADGVCNPSPYSFTLYVPAGSAAADFAAAMRERYDFVIVKSDSEYRTETLMDDILAECLTDGMGIYEKALAIHDWIIDHCEYSYDYSSGYEMLIYRRGVCAAYAEAFQMLARQAGLTCYLVGNFDHGFDMVQMEDGQWMYIDCTWDDADDVFYRYRYFGFEHTIRYAVYGANNNDLDEYISSLDRSPSYHYYVRYGYLDAASVLCESIVRQHLDNLETSFSISLDEFRQGEAFDADFNICGYLLCAQLNEKTWTEDGLKVDCFWMDQSIVCEVNQLDGENSWADYEISVAPNGICIDAYTGDADHVIVPASIFGRPVTVIGENAFYDQAGITSIQLPESITEIRGNAFQNCVNLVTVNWPSSLRIIGDKAFYACRSLAGNVSLPSGLESIGAFAFNRCSKIQSVHIPGNNIWVGDGAFLLATGLQTVVIDEGFQNIGYGMFSDCHSLTEISLPSTLYSIGKSAFSATAIHTLSIPASVQLIGNAVIYHCYELESLSVSENNAYFSCVDGVIYTKNMDTLITAAHYVQNVRIPDSVNTIRGSAFWGCHLLETVYIPDSVTMIPDVCFRECSSLTECRLGARTTGIGENAFTQCYALEHIELPDTLTEIGSGAFGNTGMYEFTIPKSVTIIGTNAFYYGMGGNIIRGYPGTVAESYAQEYGYTFVPLDENGVPFVTSGHCGADGDNLTWYLNENASLVISGNGAMNDWTAESLAPWGTSVTNVMIMDGVTSIGSNAFYGCADLIDITIADSVLNIGNDAFAGCVNLARIILPDCSSFILQWAEDHNCSDLIAIQKHDLQAHEAQLPTCTEPGTEAYWTCNACGKMFSDELAENEIGSVVIIPAKGHTLVAHVVAGTEAYWECSECGTLFSDADGANAIVNHGTCGNDLKWALDDTGLLTITGSGYMSDYLAFMGEYAPWHNLNVIRVLVDDGVTGIGYDAFYQCRTLESVVLPDTVTNLAMEAFYECTALKRIDIPNSVTDIGHGTFYGCTSLESVTLSESMTSVNYSAFQGCTKLGSIIIPAGIETINDGAFGGCSSLKDITILNCRAFNVIQWFANNGFGEYLSVHHALAGHDATEATCTETGAEAYWECELCGRLFSDEQAGNEIYSPVIIPAKGHTEVIDAAVPATCTETGLTEGKHCSVCGEILVAQEVVPALGHDWNDAVYEWAEDLSAVTATHTCKYDASHKETETVGVTAAVLSPTEDVAGSLTYTSADFTREGFTAQTKSTAIPALKDMSVIRLPAMLTVIEDEAFENLACEAVVVPDSCTSIGHHAFRNCKNLQYIRIPANVVVAPDAFEGCEGVVIDRIAE